MSEPRKAGRTERITYRANGEQDSVVIRRNRTEEATREQYMRLMNDLVADGGAGKAHGW